VFNLYNGIFPQLTNNSDIDLVDLDITGFVISLFWRCLIRDYFCIYNPYKCILNK